MCSDANSLLFKVTEQSSTGDTGDQLSVGLVNYFSEVAKGLHRTTQTLL